MRIKKWTAICLAAKSRAQVFNWRHEMEIIGLLGLAIVAYISYELYIINHNIMEIGKQML